MADAAAEGPFKDNKSCKKFLKRTKNDLLLGENRPLELSEKTLPVLKNVCRDNGNMVPKGKFKLCMRNLLLLAHKLHDAIVNANQTAVGDEALTKSKKEMLKEWIKNMKKYHFKSPFPTKLSEAFGVIKLISQARNDKRLFYKDSQRLLSLSSNELSWLINLLQGNGLVKPEEFLQRVPSVQTDAV